MLATRSPRLDTVATVRATIPDDSRARSQCRAGPKRTRLPTESIGSSRADCSHRLVLLPAVDVADGQAVQLVQGRPDRRSTSVTPGRPPSAGRTPARSGSTWSTWTRRSAAGTTPRSSPRSSPTCGWTSSCPAGSGTTTTLERALATGCARVNIGTAALENPEWCDEMIAHYGERIAVGLDVRGTRLAARGWTREGGDLMETLRPAGPGRLCPFRGHRCQFRRHAGRAEPRPAARVCAATDKPVVASGGITTLERHPGVGRDGSARGRRCDHRHRAVRGQLHHRGSPGAAAVTDRPEK